MVNHELGTMQEVAAVAECARGAGMRVHCDAVQAVGKLPVAAADLGVDTLALSGHKIGGPKGIGALWVRQGLDLGPIYPGGHQERERRPGTENLVGAVGLGRAASLVGERLAAADRVRALAERLEAAICAMDGTQIHGARGPRVGNTVNAGFAGAAGEVVVQALDLAGVSASTGAACSSGSVEPSSVLIGLGLGAEEARSAVRLSLGPSTTDDEIREVVELLPGVVERARAFA
jgi:cysteine desulfurase